MTQCLQNESGPADPSGFSYSTRLSGRGKPPGLQRLALLGRPSQDVFICSHLNSWWLAQFFLLQFGIGSRPVRPLPVANVASREGPPRPTFLFNLEWKISCRWGPNMVVPCQPKGSCLLLLHRSDRMPTWIIKHARKAHACCQCWWQREEDSKVHFALQVGAENGTIGKIAKGNFLFHCQLLLLLMGATTTLCQRMEPFRVDPNDPAIADMGSGPSTLLCLP